MTMTTTPPSPPSPPPSLLTPLSYILPLLPLPQTLVHSSETRRPVGDRLESVPDSSVVGDELCAKVVAGRGGGVSSDDDVIVYIVGYQNPLPLSSRTLRVCGVPLDKAVVTGKDFLPCPPLVVEVVSPPF